MNMNKARPLSSEQLAKSRAVVAEYQTKGIALAAAMRSDEVAEMIRRDAQIAAENGDPRALSYLKIEPTPEILSKGEFETVQARLLHQHDIRTTTKRRVLVPKVYDLHLRGVIDNEQLTVCRWYRDCWEATGLIGNIPSTDYSKEVFAAPQSRDMFTAFQLDNLESFRFAQSAISKRYLGFFEAVILADVGLERAIKLAKRRKAYAVEIFKDCISELQTAYDELKGC
jgi:hypothetical protein